MSNDDLGALHVRYGQLLGQLSSLNGKLSEVVDSNNELSRAVWSQHAQLATMDQRCVDRGRRLVAVEDWVEHKDDEVTATGRHDITRLEKQLAAMQRDKAERRRHWVRYGIAAVVGVGTSVLVVWLGSMAAGCSVL